MISTCPVLLHIPHASRVVPPEFRADFLLSNPELERELDVMTDAYTDELFAGEGDHITTLCAPISRLVVDVERFREDAREPMAARGMGAVYTRTHDGRPLRRELDEARREHLLQQYYDPHHRQLNTWAEQAVREYGRGLLIDCHSFPSSPRYYGNENKKLPDFCIGTDEFHTPAPMVKAAEAFLREQGISVGINIPFAGSLTPSDFYHKDPRVNSIMIEVNRDLYLDPAGSHRNARFEQIQQVCRELLMFLDAGLLGK